MRVMYLKLATLKALQVAKVAANRMKMKRWGRLKISPTKFHQWVSFSCQWSDKMYLDQGITVIIIRSPIKDICQKNEKYSQ